MAKRVDIAERLKELDCDPVAGMVRIAKAAEDNKNLPLAAKILGDLLEYTAPKLKSVEHSIGPETMDFLDRQQRLARIRELYAQVGQKHPEILDGELAEPQLLHIPEEP